MSTLTDYQSKINATVQDDAGHLTTTERDLFLQEAVRRYSKDRPQVKTTDITGAGSFNITLPTDWLRDFSSVVSIWYPYKSTDQTPLYLERSAWIIVETPTAQVLRLLEDTPSTSETLRLTYTVPHTLSATANTIPDADFDAVCDLGSAFYCRALAAKYAQTSDATIGADAVNYRTKSQEYSALAKALAAAYDSHIGKKEGDTTRAASVTQEWDVDFSTGDDRIVHRRKLR